MKQTRPEPRPIMLRRLEPDDAPLLELWRSEPSVRRYQPLSMVSSGELRAEIEARRHLDLYRSQGHRFDWIIMAGPRPAGWITLVIHSWDHGLAECGYALSTAFQGRGIMLRALGPWIEDLFRDTEIHRLEARCALDNQASRRVLERLGFQYEGTLRAYFRLGEERVDNALYARLRSDPAPLVANA